MRPAKKEKTGLELGNIAGAGTPCCGKWLGYTTKWLGGGVLVAHSHEMAQA